MLFFGANDIGLAVGTVTLPPGVYPTPATITGSIGTRATGTKTLLNFQVRQNTPIALDLTIVTYELKINGVTAFSVAMTASASDASDLVTQADLLPGDLIEVFATKAGILPSGLVGVVVSVEDL